MLKNKKWVLAMFVMCAFCLSGCKYLAESHYDKGIQYEKEKQWEDALKEYKKAVKYKGDFFVAYSRMGYMYEKLGQYHYAVGVYKKAVEIQPDYPFAHLGLGTSYIKLNDLESADKEREILENINKEMAGLLGEMIEIQKVLNESE